ncbi:MAG TPA: hypothetical protein VHP11_04010 [Tepidisphaeraceae bacterium]|nr:hypothetical protein [Tepidisphaeraceae bacterium]
MNRMFLVQVIVGAVGLAWSGLLFAAAPAEETPNAESPHSLRVGTFEPRTVALAYFRSTLHKDQLAAAVADHRKAKEAGDTQRMKQIEAERNREQEDAHRQVFGTGPYDSLAEKLKTIWPQVAQAKDVQVIVGQVYYAPADAQTVDVTDEILKQIGVDAKTQKIIDDLQQKIRTGQYKPEQYRGEK